MIVLGNVDSRIVPSIDLGLTGDDLENGFNFGSTSRRSSILVGILRLGIDCISMLSSIDINVSTRHRSSHGTMMSILIFI